MSGCPDSSGQGSHLASPQRERLCHVEDFVVVDGDRKLVDRHDDATQRIAGMAGRSLPSALSHIPGTKLNRAAVATTAMNPLCSAS